MAEEVYAGDGDQGREENGVDLRGDGAAGVEVGGEETDRYVEGFSGYFVLVDEGAEGAVDGN